MDKSTVFVLAWELYEHYGLNGFVNHRPHLAFEPVKPTLEK